jgi:hypothetical protein
MVVGVAARAADPLLLRAESLTVLPNSQPVVFVNIRNVSDADYAGKVALTVPEPWRITPDVHAVQLTPGEEQRLAFSVAGGRASQSNSYPVEIQAIGGGQTVTRRQRIVVASAPYFKPEIDGDPREWGDAIPVTFVAGGKKTTISTYWNRRYFSVLIAVDEEKLITPDDSHTHDAVQLAFSPSGTTTGRSPGDEAHRFEFLLVPDRSGGGTCHQLAQPGQKLGASREPRSLDRLRYDEAKIAVFRRGTITYYECSLPFTAMRKHIRPSEGREFFLGLLVHDPDGTGIRDWGEAAGLWESQRNRLAWSGWSGAQWADTPPTDCRTSWGMCSSKY